MFPEVAIKIRRLEGPIEFLHWAETFSSFEAATQYLNERASTFPINGQHKHLFNIAHKDGSVFMGYFYCSNPSSEDFDPLSLDLLAIALKHAVGEYKAWYTPASHKILLKETIDFLRGFFTPQNQLHIPFDNPGESNDLGEGQAMATEFDLKTGNCERII